MDDRRIIGVDLKNMGDGKEVSPKTHPLDTPFPHDKIAIHLETSVKGFVFEYLKQLFH